MADYVRAANEATLIAIQLEEREAIENLDELLQVPDIDVFFVGPSDLSQSMGHPGNPKAPPVAEAINRSFERIVAAGRIPGTPATVDNVKDVLRQGRALHLQPRAAAARGEREGVSRQSQRVARRGAEQGSAEPRSRGPACGDATVEPMHGAWSNADPCASLGSDPSGSLFRPSTRPRIDRGDVTPGDAHRPT